jgi:hypothetical protein
MSQVAEVKGLHELIGKMTAYPQELVKTMAVGMSASLNIFWENVPPYPAARPESTYDRTGTLGKSLGSDQSGGATGNPSIYSIKQLGGGNFEGTFGTNLEYAPYVIGDTTQAEVHKGRWWQMQTIAAKSTDKITQLWNSIGEKLAKFLDSKGV